MNIYKKHVALLGAALLLIAMPAVAQNGGVVLPATGGFTAGVWEVDSRHSVAELTTDGTSDNGETKIDVPLGVGTVRGLLTIDGNDPTKSNVNVQFYPGNSIRSSSAEEPEANLASHTLVGFHSKELFREPDGRLQARGNLTLTRVDRNLEITPSEAYSGPIYGPPVIQRISREATFVFDLPAGATVLEHGGIAVSASTKVFREDFPELVMAIVNTDWPPVIQDGNCILPSRSAAYRGAECTGTFIGSSTLPQASGTNAAEDYPGPQDFNAIAGERLNILLRMRLVAKDSPESAAAGNNPSTPRAEINSRKGE